MIFKIKNQIFYLNQIFTIFKLFSVVFDAYVHTCSWSAAAYDTIRYDRRD